MVTSIVVTHGNLAEALFQTAATIYGEFSDCYTLSNTSKSTDALANEIRELIKSLKGSPCVIFVDFLGGSCSRACLTEASARENAHDIPIISGINLPMLLAFLNKREEVPFAQLAESILERGYNSIQMLDPSKI